MASNIDIDKLAHLIEERADIRIVPRFQNLKAGDVKTKAHANDFVTIADTEMEEDFCNLIPSMFPGVIVIGEEGVASGKITTAALKDPAQVIVVVDPVDGTYNFKNGLPEFGVLLALVVGGETVAGFVYDVMGKTHYIAVKGEGAFKLPKNYTGSYKDGERLSVSTQKDMNAAKGFIEPHYFPKEVRPFLQSQLQGRFPSMRCSAHEYLNIASGKADFGVSSYMMPWDHLAGTLLVKEAGGIVQKFDGTPYTVTDEAGGIIVAATTEILKQVHDQLIQPALKIINAPLQP